jgi:hypothetical protein
MKLRAALTIGVIFAALAPRAQTQAPAASAQPKPATQYQPATTVKPAQHTDATQTGAPAKVDPAQDSAIRHLLDITDQSNIADHISGAISMQVRSIMGHTLPEDRLQQFMLDFDLNLHKKVKSSEVIDAVVPIYAQHLSLEDIQELNRFYESPLGQRVVKVMPQVMQESQSAGVKIVNDAALTTLREMTGEYPELKPMLPSESNPPGVPGQSPTPSPAPNAEVPKN